MMFEATQEAGVVFAPILSKDKERAILDDLASLWDKALAMGKTAAAVRRRRCSVRMSWT